MEMNQERRGIRYAQIRSERFNTREDTETGDLYIEGYFAVYNSPYELWPGAVEVILPGAFAESIHGDVRALVNHNTDLVLGRTTAGTLVLRDDPEHGLWGSIKINRQDTDAMNLYARNLRGDVDQASFGFEIERERFVENPDGSVRWEIEKVNPLYEVSPCTFPAYKETSLSARREDLATIRTRQAEAWRESMKKRLEATHGTESPDAAAAAF